MNRLPQSFKSIGLVVTMVIWLHGCQVYRASSVAEVKEGRTYELTLTSGKRIQGKCTGVFDEYLLIRTNENTVRFPNSSIANIRRYKISPVLLSTGLAAAVAAVVLLFEVADKGTDLSEVDFLN